MKRITLEKNLQTWEQNIELYRLGKLPEDRARDIPDEIALLRVLFFYMLPIEFTVMDIPEYLRLPRNPYEALTDPLWRTAISSDRFGAFVSWRMTMLLFRNFGLPGQPDDYSNEAPVVLLGFDLSLWGSILLTPSTAFRLEERGFFPENNRYPYINMEAAKDLFCILAQEGLKIDCIRGVLEVEKAIPCLEDFHISNNPLRYTATNPGNDFRRKWYGKRRKYQTVSLSKLSQNDEPSFDFFEESVNQELDYERFKKTLSESDQKLLILKEQGYTQTEIAKAAEYANHTTVSKHLNKIAQLYREYEGE